MRCIENRYENGREKHARRSSISRKGALTHHRANAVVDGLRPVRSVRLCEEVNAYGNLSP